MSCALRIYGSHSAARVLQFDSRRPRDQAGRERHQDQPLISGSHDHHSHPPVRLHKQPIIPWGRRVLTACRAQQQQQRQHRGHGLTANCSSYSYSLTIAAASRSLSIRNNFSLCDYSDDFERRAVRGGVVDTTAGGGGVRPLALVSITGKPQRPLSASFSTPLGSRWQSRRSWESRRRRRCGPSKRGEVSKLPRSLSSGSISLFRGLKIPARHPDHAAGAAGESRAYPLVGIRRRNRRRDHAACRDVVVSVAQAVVAAAAGTNHLLLPSRRRTAAAAAAAAATSSPRPRTKLRLGRDRDRSRYANVPGRRGDGQGRERWSRWNVDGDRVTPTGMMTRTTTVKSHAPEELVYTGPEVKSPKRITLRHVAAKYRRKEPITMVTAYDYPSAVHVDLAGIDILLVGDSVGMVVHGYDSTLPVTLEDMLTHCRAVARGARRPLLVGDLPFGSYEQSSEQAVGSAIRMLKEGSMDVVKLEGGSNTRLAAVRAVVDAGIAVMGHVGLTPQAISVLGGFRPQGKKAENALNILDQALALQEAGCFAIVLECLPSPVAAAITSALRIPTIGIGAGPHTSGQVLVYHDLLGMMQHPHHAKVTPKFCKKFAEVGKIIQGALTEFRVEVVSNRFPSDTFSPYTMEEEEIAILEAELRSRGIQVQEDQLHSSSSSSSSRHRQEHLDAGVETESAVGDSSVSRPASLSTTQV